MISKTAAKIISILMSGIMLLTGCGGESTPNAETSEETTATTEAEEPSPVTANEMAKQMGIGLNLGNTMEAYDAANCEKITYEWIPKAGNDTPSDYETKWGAPVTTKEMIKGIKDAGFDTVRIPVFWGNMMENDGKWDIDPELMARVGEIVDMSLAENLKVVVNCHHFDEFIIRRNDDEKSAEIISHLWEQIASYFKDYPYDLVFEGFNEYLGGNRFNENGELKELSKADAYKMTNLLNQTFVDAVRKTGGNNAERVLIVSGYWTNIDNTTSPLFIMPEDTASDKLMVSVHYVDNAMYWSKSIGNKKWKDYIDNQCGKLTKAFTEKNIPVFLGETTAGYPAENFAPDAEIKDSSECLDYVLEKLTDCGFVPVIWDTPDGFYNRHEAKIADDKNAEVIRKISEKLADK